MSDRTRSIPALLQGTLAAVLSCGLWLSTATGAARAMDYRDGFDSLDSALVGALMLGETDGWAGALKDGRYALDNASQSGSVRYYFLTPKRQPATLEVAVEGGFDGEQAGAGLIYGLDREAGTYYAFVVTRDGKYSVYQRSNKGLRRIAAGSNEAIRSAGPNRLEVRFEGTAVSHFINESKMMGFGLKTAVEGGVGIVAIDRGRFLFDDFFFSAP